MTWLTRYRLKHYFRNAIWIAPVVSSYVALGPELGLYASAAVGVQRDETFASWKRATDLGLDLTLGIFSQWQLVASAGYSERLNEFGQYTGTSFGLQLELKGLSSVGVDNEAFLREAIRGYSALPSAPRP